MKRSSRILALSLAVSILNSSAGPAWSAAFAPGALPPSHIPAAHPIGATGPSTHPLLLKPACSDAAVPAAQTQAEALAPCRLDAEDGRPSGRKERAAKESLGALGEATAGGKPAGAEGIALDLAFDGGQGAAVLEALPFSSRAEGGRKGTAHFEDTPVPATGERTRREVPSPAPEGTGSLADKASSGLQRFLPIAALGVVPLGLVAGKAGVLALNPWVLAGVAVAAAAVGVGVYLWKRSQNKKELWENSKSNQDIIAVESARRAGDAEALHKIAADSRSRQARMKERIADARSRGSKTVADDAKDRIKVAAAYEAFDGLAAARAELNANALSKDASRRIGLERPEVWTERLSKEEAAAQASGFEGALALRLEALASENKAQAAALARIEGDLKSFDEHVPTLFKGRLKEMSEKGKKDLEEFKTAEAVPEGELFAAKNAAMRGRVSDRLGEVSAEYRSHRERLEKLAGAADGALKSSLELARQVDKDLGDMASHERQRLLYLGLASANERVPVTKTDERGNSYVDYEDHSFTYKALAASEAASAKASASSARAGVEALSKVLPLARKDPVLQEEQLTAGLPSPDKTKVPSGSGGVFFDFFIPATWNLFGSLFSESQANQARVRFGPVLGGIEAVSREVEARRGAEARWIDGRIDSDLSAQKAQARSASLS